MEPSAHELPQLFKVPLNTVSVKFVLEKISLILLPPPSPVCSQDNPVKHTGKLDYLGCHLIEEIYIALPFF